MKFKIECRQEDAPKFLDWITNRGGIAHWPSINMSNPSASWSTPAKNLDGTPTAKPTWEASNEPAFIVTDPAEVGVYTEVLFREIPVKLKMGKQGFALKLTDASQRRLNAAMKACEAKHGECHYRKGGLEDPVMAVFYTGEIKPLG